MTQVPQSDPNREPTLREILDRINTFDQRFSDYQQATQWVVQLAFALIASSTVTVIVTAIFKGR
jgi:hypothetical protein